MAAAIKNYIFDLYGTLVDIHTDENMPWLWEKCAAFYSMKGAAYSADELRSAYNKHAEAELDALSKKNKDIPRDELEIDLGNVFRALYEDKGVHVTKKEIEDTAIAFRSISLCKLKLYNMAKDILEHLRENGKRVFLLSNAQSLFTRPELKMLGLDEDFDDIFISSELGIKKPSPLIFKALIDKHGLDVRETVMVGNDHLCDCLPAMRLGMRSMYIHTEQSPQHPEKLGRGCKEIYSLFQVHPSTGTRKYRSEDPKHQ